LRFFVLAWLNDPSCVRVPVSPGKSWIYFLENFRTWKVVEKYTYKSHIIS